MNLNESELIKRLMVIFKIEADEHLNIIGKGLIDLEKKPNNDEIIENIYRSAHSLKGASRAVNLIDIERICQSLESCFSLIKNKSLKTQSKHFDLFHNALKLIEKSLTETEEKPSEETINNILSLLNNIENIDEVEIVYSKSIISEPTENDSVIQKNNDNITNKFDNQNTSLEDTQNLAKIESVNQEIVESSSKQKNGDTIRLSIKKLDNLSILAEESIQIKLSINHIISGLNSLSTDIKPLMKEWSEFSMLTSNLKQSIYRQPIDNYNIITENIDNIEQNINDYTKQLNAFENKINSQLNKARQENISLSSILDNFTDEITQVLMIPFSNLLDSFPLLVRDLAKDMDKEVDLEIFGSEIEIDRRIIEKLKDPLIHIIRNCVDHGIEKPELRINNNKTSNGNININIQQVDGNYIQVRISDDGQGIDRKKILSIAESKKLISQSDIPKLNDQQILNLIFNSGFSSSSIITDISGRGLGLAIVKEKVDQLGGKVNVESIEGQGTVFMLSIPSKVAKYKGVLLETGNKKFIVAISNIIEIVQVFVNKIKKIENRETIQYDDTIVPLVNPNEILKIDNNQLMNEKPVLTVVIVESLDRRIGIIVDKVYHEQDVLFKKLNYPLKNIRNISGVCVLGSGNVVPVLNIQDVIKTAHQKGSSIFGKTDKIVSKKDEQHSILVAEDSITSRMFLKNILESAGYYVKTTVDGKEALTELLENKYDIMVSDIEMPRMNGFELTENIRKNKKIKTIPVILVTSLSSQHHKEKGIEVGADAYITKSSFEQSNLLEIIQRFL